MKIKYGIILASSAMIAVSGCSKPVTERPEVDQASLNKETAAQRKAIETKAQKISTKPVTSSELRSMKSRIARVGKRITNAGKAMCKDMGRDVSTCVYGFNIKAENNLNAYADGKEIYVTPVMMRFASTDNELAVVLGHEYAHNLMGHIASKKTNILTGMGVGFALDMVAEKALGVNTGGKLQELGASQGANAYSPSFESEADYVGLYVTSRAGYDINKGSYFWRKMTIASPKGAFTTTTHPSNPQRSVLLEKSKNEINEKRRARAKLVPNIKLGEDGKPVGSNPLSGLTGLLGG